ncbi:hypothetical protein ALC57_10076 [Trachymyrmex cornetzi]|uniref:Uncharacterized protein n=1 Tax=Trachymyrmex cornetzi TaxID=471704 RepID=A0A195DYC9_9HYME|nr:hypothetical protein ALC57_10076 [Trachymyrmex cornetzi]
MSTNDYVRNVGCATLSAGLNLIYVEHSVNDESDAACDKRVASFSTLSLKAHIRLQKGKTPCRNKEIKLVEFIFFFYDKPDRIRSPDPLTDYSWIYINTFKSTKARY